MINNKSLQKVLDEIDKKFGDGTARLFGDAPDKQVDVISSGIPTLDELLGGGGFPRGHVVEVFGPEGGGKTTLALQTVREAQKLNLGVAYIDLEHALNPEYASGLGVDMDSVIVSQPPDAETALEVVEKLVRSGEIALIIIDSVAAMSTRAEIDGEMSDVTVGGVPRLMGRALRKLAHPLDENNCLLFFINQVRDKIGTFGYGNPETTPGGKALKFAASVRVDIRRVGDVKSGEAVVGAKTRLKVAKNRFAAPATKTEVELIFGEGFTTDGDVFGRAMESGVITKKGGYYMFGEENFAQGISKARAALKNKDFASKIKEALKAIDTKEKI